MPWMGSRAYSVSIMAGQGDTGTKEDIKTQFTTVEGVYRLLPPSEYSRPNRVAYSSSGGGGSTPAVRVSLVKVPDSTGHDHDRTKICFNYGRELFVYTYRGIKKVRGSRAWGEAEWCSGGTVSISAGQVPHGALLHCKSCNTAVVHHWRR